MLDPTGQLADRLHLLELAHLRLGGMPLAHLVLQADIGGFQRGQAPAAVTHREEGERHHQQGAQEQGRARRRVHPAGVGGAQREKAILLCGHAVERAAHARHVLPPGIAPHHRQRILAAAEMRQCQAGAELVELRLNGWPQQRHIGALARIVARRGFEPVELGRKMRTRRLIGLKIIVAPGQQIAALAGLRLGDQAAHQVEPRLHLDGVANAFGGGILPGGQKDRERRACEQQQETEAERQQRPNGAAGQHGLLPAEAMASPGHPKLCGRAVSLPIPQRNATAIG